jgi:hypothetical protein
MSLVLLPTAGLIRDFHRGAVAIDMLDYDLDEFIRIILDALLYPDWYPDSFGQLVCIDSGNCRPHYPPDKVLQFNELLAMLYHRLHTALVNTDLYQTGALQHTYFCVYDHDVVVSDEPIKGKLGDQLW